MTNLFFCILQAHFEQSQFEQNRLDGNKLRWNAVPTIFDVPNAPKLVSDKRKRRAENVQPDNTIGHDHIYVKRHHSEETESDASCLVENPVDHIYSKRASISRTECHQDMKDVGEVTEQSAVEEEHQSASAVEESVEFVETVDSNSKNSVTEAKLKKRIKQLEQKLRMVQKSFDQMTTSLKKFLNEDQIRWLKLPMKSKRTVRWSNSTVKRCLQQRYVMGAKGYNHLLKLGYPVPAYRTLCERVENASFRPGLQHDVMEWLQVKISSAPDSKFQDCSLAMDEMQLRPCIEYDKGDQILNTVDKTH